MIDSEEVQAQRIEDVLEDALDMQAVVRGEARLSAEGALRLLKEAPLSALSRWATAMTDRLHGGPGSLRTYVIDRNINYSNVCSAHCTFCAFRRDIKDGDAYVLDREQLHQKVSELVDAGGTQVLLQGGMHPGLPLSFYEDMISGLRQAFPHVNVHGFSPPEFVEFVAVLELDGYPSTAAGRSQEIPTELWLEKLRVILKRLIDAGLGSLPGGGAEMFPSHVRRRLARGKADATQWMTVMAEAQKLGLNTSASMMFGHVEGLADRVMHLSLFRDWQDKAIRENWQGRYLNFVCWPFQPDNTPLGDLPEYDWESGDVYEADGLAEAIMRGEIESTDKKACGKAFPRAGKQLRLSGASDYLRTQAVARLFLDNIPSVGSSWVTMGPHVGQLGLFYGAGDMGSIMMEENVVSSAGTTWCLDEATLCRLIREAGYVPAQRMGGHSFEIVKVCDGAASPDLLVTNWQDHRQSQLHQQSPKTCGGDSESVSLTVEGM